MGLKICWSVFLLMILETTSGFRILAVFPHIGKSHHNMFTPLMEGLAEKGHNVTVISHFPAEKTIKNYNDISLKGSVPIWFSAFSLVDVSSTPGIHRITRHIIAMEELLGIGYTTCQALLENREVQRIKEGDFDLVILEQFNSDCGLGIAYKVKAPFIGLASHLMMAWTPNRLGLFDNPSFVPSHYLYHGSSPNFLQTLEAFIVNNCYKLAYYFYSQVPEHALMTHYYGNDLPPLEDIAKNMSMILVNTYHSLTSAVPRSPNHIEIGGIHIQDSNSTLRGELLEYLDGSDNGVILFTMGSMLISSSWPDDKLTAFKEAFAELPQNILWKWDSENMTGAPLNVKLMKWIPQYDILRHRNVKAFITHAGMLGTVEAVNCGVPVVTIPMFGDQFANAAAAKDSGSGVHLDYFSITKKTVLKALKEALSPKMQRSAKKASELWKDRPSSPLETAIYWVEHVARHGGSHLRPASADLPLYRYLLLDVICFLTMLGLILSFIIYKSFNLLGQRIFSSTKSKTD